MQAEPKLMFMPGKSGELETFWAAVSRASSSALHSASLSCLSQGAGQEAVEGPRTFSRAGNLAVLFPGLLEGRLLLVSPGREELSAPCFSQHLGPLVALGRLRLNSLLRGSAQAQDVGWCLVMRL